MAQIQTSGMGTGASFVPPPLPLPTELPALPIPQAPDLQARPMPIACPLLVDWRPERYDDLPEWAKPQNEAERLALAAETMDGFVLGADMGPAENLLFFAPRRGVPIPEHALNHLTYQKRR